MNGAPPRAPPWLFEALSDPPLAAKALTIVAAGLVLSAAARRIYRRDIYVSREEQRQMLLIVVTVESVAVATLAALHATTLGYAGVVLVGCICGLVASELLRQLGRVVGRAVDNEPALLAAAWWSLVIVSMGGYQLSFDLDVAYPAGLGAAVGAVSVVMLAWTVVQELGEYDTVGEAVREALDG